MMLILATRATLLVVGFVGALALLLDVLSKLLATVDHVGMGGAALVVASVIGWLVCDILEGQR